MPQDIERQAKAQGYLVQLLAGMETLKCAGAEATAVERYANLYADCLDVSVKRGRSVRRSRRFTPRCRRWRRW